MARYLLLAMNGPTAGEGDADALEQWYVDEHLPGFKAIPEVKSARRYNVLRGNAPGVAELWPKVAAYEIETDDPAALQQRLAQDLSASHPALDRARSAYLMCVQIAGDD